MTKTLTLYEQLSEFWSEKILKKESSIKTMEKQFRVKYNIDETYIANSLFENDLLDYINSPLSSEHKLNTIHNKNTVCLLFPDYALRIACTKNFIKNMPFVQSILSGDWDQSNVIRYSYFNQDVCETVDGATMVLITENTLDSILFETPYECKVRDYEQKGYYQIRKIKCNNLQELLILTNKNRYELNNFGGDSNRYDDY